MTIACVIPSPQYWIPPPLCLVLDDIGSIELGDHMGGLFHIGGTTFNPSTAEVMGRHYWFSAEKQCKALKDEQLGPAEPSVCPEVAKKDELFQLFVQDVQGVHDSVFFPNTYVC